MNLRTQSPDPVPATVTQKMRHGSQSSRGHAEPGAESADSRLGRQGEHSGIRGGHREGASATCV